MNKIAILASGSGSNAENIANYFNEADDVSIELMICNRKDAFVFERAKKLGIKSLYIPKSGFEDGSALAALKGANIDYVILAGFLLLIPEDIINHYEGKILNIHPALLPKFGGKGMYGDNVHKAVVESGENKSGITIHEVSAEYDRGDIIFQAECEVLPSDTYSDVAEKVHALEYEYFPQVIDSFIE